MVKIAMIYISKYEEAVATAAKRHRVDGLVCGHILRAEITSIDGITYMNAGAWVESCTALVERADGSMHLLHWSDEQQAVKSAWLPNNKDARDHAAWRSRSSPMNGGRRTTLLSF